uniref:PB66L n=1 Tax=African swine fever virus TaxID=10497 RepID=A0A6G7KTR0_ASF
MLFSLLWYSTMLQRISRKIPCRTIPKYVRFLHVTAWLQLLLLYSTKALLITTTNTTKRICALFISK